MKAPDAHAPRRKRHVLGDLEVRIEHASVELTRVCRSAFLFQTRPTPAIRDLPLGPFDDLLNVLLGRHGRLLAQTTQSPPFVGTKAGLRGTTRVPLSLGRRTL